ncbi:MAG TPA: phosphoglucomutase [Clostridiales bacterium]|nr:MAG: hypothetical protein A2Y22_02785 [Clostridiales bacterium GWD2_32_59]HAN10734.1 phosphoglucomutase [Clostridiales bacterium]
MDYRGKYEFWLTSDFTDEDTKNELRAIKDDEKEIEERFYKELDFGTAGLRGIIGAGTNYVNKYTIRKATQGVANYILKHEENPKERGVAIAFDSRTKSEEFAMETARVFIANGIKTYLFNELRPIPELGFAIRHLNCVAGIMVTASHNMPVYNGYKVLGDRGDQVVEPKDKRIIEEVNKINNYGAIKIISDGELEKSSLLIYLDESMDNKFIDVLIEELIDIDLVKKAADTFKIVYTPINGSGNIPVRLGLKEMGFKNVFVVPKHEFPDSNFSGLKFPNPEFKEVFEEAMPLAEKENADLIFGTDPDSDRVGVIVKNGKGEYEVLSGNMLGVLLLEYIIHKKRQNNTLAKNAIVIKNLVSTRMADAITKYNDIKLLPVLIGFKYFGEKINEWDETKEYDYIFGFEEAFGYLPGKYIRDKDGVGTSMLICEMAAYYKTKGMTIYEGLQEIYKKYGYYMDDLVYIRFKGKEGLEKIDTIINILRKEGLREIGGKKVVKVTDYQEQTVWNLIENKKEEYKVLAKSNILVYELEDESWVAIRPSGNQPELKNYMGVKGDTEEEAIKKMENIKRSFMLEVEKIN